MLVGAYLNLGRLYLEKHKNERARKKYRDEGGSKTAPGDSVSRLQFRILLDSMFQSHNLVTYLSSLVKIIETLS